MSFVALKSTIWTMHRTQTIQRYGTPQKKASRSELTTSMNGMRPKWPLLLSSLVNICVYIVKLVVSQAGDNDVVWNRRPPSTTFRTLRIASVASTLVDNVHCHRCFVAVEQRLEKYSYFELLTWWGTRKRPHSQSLLPTTHKRNEFEKSSKRHDVPRSEAL